MISNENAHRLLKKMTGKIFCGLLILSILFFFLSFKAVGAGNSDSIENKTENPDLIRIDSMKMFGGIEEAPVDFNHDLHTAFLVKTVNDCALCHKSEGNRLIIKFLRTEDTDRQNVMEIYHNGCIGCHETSADKKGPVACRECHQKKQKKRSSAMALGFDKSLHFRHTETLENNCSTCHHEYDEKSEKKIYVKGKESSCIYCHKKEKEADRISIREASHKSCVVCHVSMKQSGKSTGPVNCSGCHDLEKQKLIEKVKNPPRLKRQQPDQVLIKTGNPQVDNSSKNRMDFVRFNHENHEKANKDCKTCHHKAVSKCSACHEIMGTKEGGFISLERAMHDTNAEQSCTGCHNTIVREKECAGCHALITASKVKSETNCRVCHKSRFDITGEKISDLFHSLEETVTNRASYGAPENVSISKLENQYQAVDFPHGKIIRALDTNIKKSGLARAFHAKNELLCSGCHHNLPVTKKPSACSTCHDAVISKTNSGKPGLTAAYHLQCMECHDQMKIDKNGCTDCHKKK